MVTIAESGFPMQRCCQLARNQNLQHSPEFYLQLTFADIIFSLCTQYDILKLKEHRVTASTITDEFSGNEKYESACIKQTAQAAMRLPISVIKNIREVANQENPKLCFSSDVLNKFHCETAEDLMKVADCRPYRKFIQTSSH